MHGHAAPNLKQSFRLHREGDTLHDLRNRATDLALPKPKRESVKGVSNTMELSIGIIYLLKQKMQIHYHIQKDFKLATS